MKRVAAIILAAGGSARLGGRPKQLLTCAGESLVRRAVRAAVEAGCGPVIVVAGVEVEGLAREIKDLPAHIAHNLDWERGLGTSIRKGVEELLRLEPLAGTVLLMVCDQPFVTKEVIAALVGASAQSAKQIIASAYADTLGVPALFDRAYFSQLATLPENRGAKGIITSHPEDVVGVPFPQGALDIDTAADYEKYAGQ